MVHDETEESSKKIGVDLFQTQILSFISHVCMHNAHACVQKLGSIDIVSHESANKAENKEKLKQKKNGFRKWIRNTKKLKIKQHLNGLYRFVAFN